MSSETTAEKPNPTDLARANFERVVGEVLMFFSAMPGYSDMFIKDIPRIITPIALKQFEITRTKEGLIVGFRSWAMVTEALAKELEENPTKANALVREDWNSGSVKVTVDAMGMASKPNE